MKIRFIQNGQRTVVSATPYLSSGMLSWQVFDRSGNQIGILGIRNLDPHEILSVPDGLIYSARATDIQDATGYLPRPNAATTALMYIDTTQPFTNNDGTRQWLGEPNKFPELIRVSERQTSALPMPGVWSPLDNHRLSLKILALINRRFVIFGLAFRQKSTRLKGICSTCAVDREPVTTCLTSYLMVQRSSS